MAESVVQAQGLYCAHGWRYVVRDVSFQIETGEIAVIVGVNGVGKTTLLSTIAGALSAAKGSISVFGHRRRQSAAAERLARDLTLYLPDRHWLPPTMLVREYLGSVGELFGLSRCEIIDQINDLTDLFDLTSVGNHLLGTLSTGQRKKVGLCTALMAPRRLLLLDEPFSGGLDPGGITALRRTLRHRAHKTGQTIVMTTPVPEFVTELADRLLVLKDGLLSHNLTREDLRKVAPDTEHMVDTLNSLIFPDVDSRIDRYLAGRTK
ncbi:MAG: ABC transporter ATP-binding protein [Planctomyces sp.]|nr:ABC transporter ATP-binding protein [Planctomyces sp.]